jgi:hypothetical protein
MPYLGNVNLQSYYMVHIFIFISALLVDIYDY